MVAKGRPHARSPRPRGSACEHTSSRRRADCRRKQLRLERHRSRVPRTDLLEFVACGSRRQSRDYAARSGAAPFALQPRWVASRDRDRKSGRRSRIVLTAIRGPSEHMMEADLSSLRAGLGRWSVSQSFVGDECCGALFGVPSQLGRVSGTFGKSPPFASSIGSTGQIQA